MLHHSRGFERQESAVLHSRVQSHLTRCDWSGPSLKTIYAGIAGQFVAKTASQVAIAVRDETYLLDFLETSLSPSAVESEICDFVISELHNYSDLHAEKVLGAALPKSLHLRCPKLCARLWEELDIVPIVLDEAPDTARTHQSEGVAHLQSKDIDEQAESLSRKCIKYFGPNNLPFLHVGLFNEVEVDAGFHINIVGREQFEKSVRPKTWSAVQHYVDDLKSRNVKIAFFSATPQGGGVALMRHALVRLSNSIGLDLKWYVPKPRPGVFRVTKNNHNILQGVSDPEERLTPENKQSLTNWIQDNARRHWTRRNGPLCHPSEGGADVIIIDDPQMPALIPIAKQIAPDRPIIYRSHIQMRSDLIAIPGSPQAEVWDFLWKDIQHADVFISHPVDVFVPHNVPDSMVGYMPACTDWLDGLNKNMRDWDVAHYGRIFNHACRDSGMPQINYPEDQYIVQIARFDPSKGIPDVLKSYRKFRELLSQSHPSTKAPKLLICGHGSIDDPDGTIIYDEVVRWIGQNVPSLTDDICVMRLGPSDQILNTLLSKASIVLQLSEREGFEVKVSEAIHKGKPVIANRAGGIPLQIRDQRNGFLVDVGDTDSVAQHLLKLWTDKNLHHQMSSYALEHGSDEVSTVGQALNWFYLSSKLSRQEKIIPNREWIQDMARQEIGQDYNEADGRLKRSVDEK